MQGFSTARHHDESDERVSIDNMGLLADALQGPLKDLVDPEPLPGLGLALSPEAEGWPHCHRGFPQMSAETTSRGYLKALRNRSV